MEAQLQRPTHAHGQYYEVDVPHEYAVIGGDEGEGGERVHHGEKKSVLKKVKDKAKRIKDTITKHGHEHEYRHDQVSEEEDEDEDMVNAPGVHAYESQVIPGTNLPTQTDVNLENPTDRREDRYSPIVGDEGVFRTSGLGKMETEWDWSSVEARWHEFEPLPQSRLVATSMEEVKVAEPVVQIGPLTGLEEDPEKIHPSNYQSKVTDPTGEGAREAEVAPILDRLDNFHIHGEPESNPSSTPVSYAGTHDQFAPQPTPTVDQFTPEPNPVECESMPQDTIAGKISSTTSALAGKAISAKDMMASKIGYGDNQHQDDDVSSKKSVTELAAEYGHRVYEKVAGASSVMMSKGGDMMSGATSAVMSKGGDMVAGASSVMSKGGDMVVEGADRGVSVKEYLVEKLRPGDEDKALSEAITGRFYKRKDEGVTGKEEEVTTRFGTGEEVTGGGSPRGGVVDRVKGAVGSWLGKTSETQSAESHESGAGSVSGE